MKKMSRRGVWVGALAAVASGCAVAAVASGCSAGSSGTADGGGLDASHVDAATAAPCADQSKCPNDTSWIGSGCASMASNPTCGGDYTTLVDCMATNQTCKDDGTTDMVPLATTCKASLDAYTNCALRKPDGGGADGGASSCDSYYASMTKGCASKSTSCARMVEDCKNEADCKATACCFGKCPVINGDACKNKCVLSGSLRWKAVENCAISSGPVTCS